jgi:hypothetical protein
MRACMHLRQCCECVCLRLSMSAPVHVPVPVTERHRPWITIWPPGTSPATRFFAPSPPLCQKSASASYCTTWRRTASSTWPTWW